ncbi:hypothetical protein F5Y03DRAFT_368113 [Xylaria venustula]|nr:hypothetical protein F5Y03DRAFT_368113 [Xylaria venustula]
MVNEFSWLIRHKLFGFPVICIYKTQPAKFASLVKGIDAADLKLAGIDINGEGVTVPESSACLKGVPRFGLPVRHNLLHKHADPKGQGFKLISEGLKQFYNVADDVLNERIHPTRTSRTSELELAGLLLSDYYTAHRKNSRGHGSAKPSQMKSLKVYHDCRPGEATSQATFGRHGGPV